MATPAEVTALINALYRQYFGKLVSGILHYAHLDSIAIAEDLVQDTFLSAYQNWTENSLPLQPEAWLYKVCKNKALNYLKKNQREAVIIEDEGEEPDFLNEAIPDSQLKMLFACAHPALSPKAQVTLILKYVINLRTDEIVSAFGSNEEAITKLLSRSKQKLKELKVDLISPLSGELQEKLPVVHKAIYLIFNSGYKSLQGNIINKELCLEAVALTRNLLESTGGNSETKALYALLLFNAARLDARTGNNGELFDLEQQDRSLWNKPMIQVATRCLQESRKAAEPGIYHIEASISYLHSIAPSFQQTDWNTIVGLYHQLKLYNPSPFVELSLATAIFFSGDTETALHILQQLKKQPYISQYYLFQATYGKVLQKLGYIADARICFQQALAGTRIPAEQQYIQKLIAALG